MFDEQTEKYDVRQQRDREEGVEKARGTDVGIEEVERLDEMQASWARGSEQLLALKSGLGGTVARMEKAQRAVGVLGER